MDAADGAPDGLGRQVDDRAPPSTVEHDARRRLGAEEPGLEIDVEDEVPVALAHLEQRHPRIDARVVDEDVEGAELARDPRDHLPRLGHARDVGLDEHRAPAGRADLVRRLLGRGAIVEVVDPHVGAVAGERERDGAPDPLLGAGDERDLSPEPHPTDRTRRSGYCASRTRRTTRLTLSSVNGLSSRGASIPSRNSWIRGFRMSPVRNTKRRARRGSRRSTSR